MTTLVTIAALIVRKISPQAAGSGVGEMKVVLKGVVLKGNLTHISKLISLVIKIS
jgi:H+/Cl- antiporter ClcA